MSEHKVYVSNNECIAVPASLRATLAARLASFLAAGFKRSSRSFSSHRRYFTLHHKVNAKARKFQASNWYTDLLISVHGSKAAGVTRLATLGGYVLNLLLGTFDDQRRKLKVI
jgi:hypothetical protein